MSWRILRQFISFFTIIAMLVMVFGIVVGSAQAVSPPNIVTYQGRVLDANGVPVSSSSLSMKFFLYTAATGGTCVWSNSSGTCHSNTPASTTARTVTITNGLFTENLGDTAASTPYSAIADSTFADNASIYLAVEIAGETLSPRKQLVAAPYALNAETLDGVDLTTLQLWEVGTNGSYEDDAATVVGVDAAFSYGSGGVGDLRVADQLEVMDDGFIDNDFIVGASTSSTETITNAGFTLGGNDLFAASDVGIEGNLYLDGDVAIDGDDLTADGDLTITGATGLNLVATTGTLDLSTTAAANITATLGGATNLFNVLTGNIKIGTGTPTNTQDGEDLYVTGRFEADGDVRIDNALAVNNATASDSYINMNSTGDFIIYDNGSAFATFSDAGAITISLDATDNPAFLLTDSGTSNVTFNLASTGDFVVQDNGTAAMTVNDSGNVIMAGELSVSGAVTFSNTLGVTSTATVGDLSCTDCIDFAEMVDAMSLDTSSSIAQDGAETFTLSNGGSGNTIVNVASTGDFVVQDNGTDYFTFNDDRSIDYSSNQTTTDPFDFTVDSVTAGNGMDLSADGLTTGRGLYLTSTSGSLSSADLSAMATSGTYTASATVTGNVIDLSRSLIVSDGSAGTISNLNVTSPVATISDNCSSAGNDVCTTSGNVLLLTQSFTSSGNVLGISNAGTGDAVNIAGAGTGTAIDIDATTYAIDLEMQNGLTLDNDDDNDLNLIENSLTLNFDFGEATADEIGYSSANDLNFISTSTNSDSMVLFANGNGGGVTIIGGSAATDAGENGNDVALEAADDVIFDSGDDVSFGMADDVNFVLASGGNLFIDAATTDSAAGVGVIDLDIDTLSGIGIDLDVEAVDDTASTGFVTGINIALTHTSNDADQVYGIWIAQADTTADVAATTALIELQNNEATQADDDITAGIHFTTLGTAGFTYGIDLSGTTVDTAELRLSQGQLLDGNDDNDIDLTENSLTLNLDFGEATASEIGYSSSSDLNFISTSINSDSMVLFANGNGGGVTIIGGSAATDAGENGNDVALEAGDDVLIDSGDDVGFGMADDATFTLAAGGNVVIDAATTDHTTITGALDINFDSSTNFASGINLAVTAVNDNAADSIIGLFIDQTIQNDTTATDTVYGAMINVTNSDTAAAGTGLYIDIDDDGVGIVNSGITISNSQATDIDLTDALLIQATTSDSIADAVDVSDAEITNALNAGQNFIVHDTTRMFSSSGTITWEDTSGNDLMTLTDNSDVGDLALTGDLQVNGRDITTSSGALTINPATYTRIGDNSTPGSASTDDDFYASGALEVDGTSYFDGIVDIDVADAWTTTTTGILEMDIIAGDAAVYGEHIALTQGNGATAGREATAFGILLDAEDQDGNLIGLNIRNQSGTSAGVAGNYEAMLRITNTETATAIVTDAILIEDSSSTAGTIIDAIDVSDTEITNAINAAANFIVFDTTREFGSSTGVITWEDTSGNDLMTLTDNTDTGDLVLSGDAQINGGDVTTSSGALTINPTTYTRIGNVSTPGNASTDDDLYVSGAFEVDGTSYFDGVVDLDNAGSTFTSTGGYVDADLTVGDQGAGGPADFFNIALTQADGVTSGRDAVAMNINLSANDVDGDMFGLEVVGQSTVNAAAGSYEALIKLVNFEGTAEVVTDAIKILSLSTTDGDFVDGLDASDANITNAVNIGANAIAGTNFSVSAGGIPTFVMQDDASSNQEAVCFTSSGTFDDNSNDAGATLWDCNGGVNADYAELYPTNTDIAYGDIVVPGSKEVVTSDGQTIVQLVKSSQAYQGPVAGIVSNNYNDFTSAGYNVPNSEHPMPVALVGRVPVNVTNENGSIKIGDYLTTSSTPGYAMKATEIGRVIGMALADFSGTSGQVMVQVNNGWYLGDVISSDGSSTVVTDKAVMAPLSIASASQPRIDSYGFALRGSAWNGVEAQAVEMLLKTSVTDTNNFRLSIRNTTDTEIAYITNTGTMQISGDMVITGKLYPSDRGTAQTDKYIYYDGSDGAGGDFMRTNAKGWSTGSYDFAEMFPSDDILQAGEVVVFAESGQRVSRSMEASSARIAGIVSTRPGFLAGDNAVGSHPIALAGRVPTRVTSENGEVKVGDPLTTSSKPGYAMKATEPGVIVGYALEPVVTGDASILVYVNVGYWGGEATSIIPGTNNQASGFASGTNVNYSALNMSGNIYVSGNEILSVGRIAGIGDVWSIDQDGTMKTEGLLKVVTRSHADEKVETIAVTSPEAVITLTGTAKLSDGQVEVRFEDFAPSFNDVTAAEAPLRVIVTPSGPVSLYVSEKDNNHFVVKQFAGESADVEFDWMVTAYRKGYEPTPAPVIPIDPAPPVSPDQTLIDSLTEDDGGEQAEQPSESVVESAQSESETTLSEEISSVQEDVAESGT